MDFEIVTDSCCNLLEDMIDDFGIHILPLTFMVDGEDEVYQSYLKGERTDLKQFYTMMREGKVFKTSLPNLAESEALFRELLGSGRDVLYENYLKMIIAAGAMTAATLPFYHWFSTKTTSLLVSLLAAIVVAMIVYFIACLLLRVKELGHVVVAIAERFHRRRPA